MNGDISFASNDLQTEYIKTEFINHGDIPQKNVDLYEVANANKSAIPNVDYPNRIITISGTLKTGEDVSSGSTRQEMLDELIDTFKGYFTGKDENLDINYAGTTRRYTATVNSLGIDRGVNGKYATFNIEFICTDPFGREITATEIADESGHTSSTYNTTPTIGGNALSQMPVFTITVNSLTGDGDYIQVSNDNNEQKILILGQSIEAGDVITIDSENREVRINGELVDFDGTFIELAPGAQSLTYTDGFDTRDVDIQIEYYKRYL